MVSTKGKAYLITEGVHTHTSPTIIAEQKNVTKFVAEIQEAEVPNRNRRIYSKEALQNAIGHYSIQEKLKYKSLFGEANHPLSNDPKRQMHVDLNNVSHIMTDLWWEGNKLMAAVETTDTRVGRDMRGLIRQGTKVAFSMRGMSDNVKRDGEYTRVGSPLMITCWDWVVIPSHPNSYMVSEDANSSDIVTNLSDKERAILTEGTMTPYDSGDLLKYVVESSKNVQEMIETYGFKYDLENMSLGKDQVVSIKENNEILKVFLEDSIKSELDDYYSKIIL